MNNPEKADLNRREFLRGGSFATLMTMLGGVELIRPAPVRALDLEEFVPFQVKCAVIGLGAWGREMLATLTRLKTAQIVAVCDPYPASLRRGAGSAPGATAVEDYRKILDDPEVQAVIIATPTHQHRDLAIAALEAGKHVYCEAPLAGTIDDARAIARAARSAFKQVFQTGLQLRSFPHRHFLLDFVRTGAAGKPVKAYAQWHKKQSWRSTSANPDRERELNWRLRRETSTGLVGEIGIHQIDAMRWFLDARPVSVNGFGSLIRWNDGREIPDTVEAVFGFPGGVRFTYACTLANSFDSEYDLLHGTDAAIMVRGANAWMFKEVDAALLGWEVYAHKDQFHNETGIALVANATKSAPERNSSREEEASFTTTPLYHALEAFLTNAHERSTAIEDFAATFDAADQAALVTYLAGLKMQPAAGYIEGYESAVMAITAQEAILKGDAVAFQKEWFELE